MRQSLTPHDEPHLLLRSLSLNYRAGATEPEHCHSWSQLLYAGAGALSLRVGDTQWMVPRGRAILIPAQLPHELTMLGPVELRSLYLAPKFDLALAIPRAFEVCALLHELIVRACQIGALDQRISHHQQVAALVATEIRNAPDNAIQLPMPADNRALHLIHWISQRDQAQTSLDELLPRAGLSRRTAERLFMAQTGLTPARWRRLYLLTRALGDLSAGQSVANTWVDAGYRSQSAFSEAFARLFGWPPGKARHH
ncbi:MAG: helix-turn-helix transcriptional regulator [Lysobacterales bacterium]